MDTLFTIILVVTSLVMIVAILLQSGQGSGLAAGFGGASAGTKVFGGSGAGGFLLKMTVVLGAVFMISSMALSYMSSRPKSALAGIESAASGQSKATQAETIVTHGSGAADPTEPDAPAADPAPSLELNMAPEADDADEGQAEPVATPDEPTAAPDEPTAAPAEPAAAEDEASDTEETE